MLAGPWGTARTAQADAHKDPDFIWEDGAGNCLSGFEKPIMYGCPLTGHPSHVLLIELSPGVATGHQHSQFGQCLYESTAYSFQLLEALPDRDNAEDTDRDTGGVSKPSSAFRVERAKLLEKLRPGPGTPCLVPAGPVETLSLRVCHCSPGS